MEKKVRNSKLQNVGKFVSNNPVSMYTDLAFEEKKNEFMKDKQEQEHEHSLHYRPVDGTRTLEYKPKFLYKPKNK